MPEREEERRGRRSVRAVAEIAAERGQERRADGRVRRAEVLLHDLPRPRAVREQEGGFGARGLVEDVEQGVEAGQGLGAVQAGEEMESARPELELRIRRGAFGERVDALGQSGRAEIVPAEVGEELRADARVGVARRGDRGRDAARSAGGEHEARAAPPGEGGRRARAALRERGERLECGRLARFRQRFQLGAAGVVVEAEARHVLAEGVVLGTGLGPGCLGRGRGNARPDEEHDAREGLRSVDS